MRILITSGLAGRDVGGPAQYGPNLEKSLNSAGYRASLASYGSIEKRLPIGFRHLYFFLKICPEALRVKYVLALDTYSVGIPSILFSILFRKKLIIRVGGDFLYSAYLNRTSAKITLKEFYRNLPPLSFKEQIILYATKLLIGKADYLAFNTEWQRQIWKQSYSLEDHKTGVVRNFVPGKGESLKPKAKNFLWAGRIIPEKNIEMLKSVAGRIAEKHADFRLDIVSNEPRENILEKLKSSYCAVSPALTDVCPNFIIEAISFNKPFIVTTETGLNELYPKGGIYADPKDELVWERAIEQMLDESVHDTFAGELAINKVTHSWQQVAQDFIEIWKTL